MLAEAIEQIDQTLILLTERKFAQHCSSFGGVAMYMEILLRSGTSRFI